MPLNLEQSATLMDNIPFRKRCKVSCLKFADSIFIEATSTPAHNTRLRWADQTFRSPDAAAAAVQPGTVMDPAVQAAGVDPVDGDSTIEDLALQAAVEGVVVNKIL